MKANGLIVLAIILTCAAASRFGQTRRKSGRSVSPRDMVMVMVMAIAWAAAWLAIALPSLVASGQSMPWSDILPVTLALFGLATTPLLLVLAATWLTRLNSGACKKAFKPDPLD
jgi:hypothetical protein